MVLLCIPYPPCLVRSGWFWFGYISFSEVGFSLVRFGLVCCACVWLIHLVWKMILMFDLVVKFRFGLGAAQLNKIVN